MNRERWLRCSKREQLLHIAAEFERARIWQDKKDKKKFRMALERALELIDLSLNDKQWRNNRAMLLDLREAVARFYIGDDTRSIAVLSAAL